MAISTRAELESEIAAWLDRSDVEARIPGFISLFEGEANRKIRGADAIARCRGTINQGYVELHDRYLELISVRLPLIPCPKPITYKPPDELATLFYAEPSGTPRYFTILGREMQFAPAPADATVVEMVFYKYLQLGPEPAATNWLLTKFPDVYLWGSLVMSNAFLKHDERVTTWADRLSNAMEELNQSSRMSQLGGKLNRTGSGMDASPR